jgi:hypothetical protein
MAFITGSTPERGYEKSSVKDMLQEPFSSRPVDCGAGAVGTNGRLVEDSHDKHLLVSAGSNTIHLNLPCVATYREWRGQGSREAKNEWCQRRTGDVDEIRFSNQAPELKEAGLADRCEWECTVILTSCRSLCDKGDFELWRPARIAEIGEASGK